MEQPNINGISTTDSGNYNHQTSFTDIRVLKFRGTFFNVGNVKITLKYILNKANLKIEK